MRKVYGKNLNELIGARYDKGYAYNYYSNI